MYLYTYITYIMCLCMYTHTSPRLPKIIPLHYFYIKTVRLFPTAMPCASNLRNKNANFCITYFNTHQCWIPFSC